MKVEGQKEKQILRKDAEFKHLLSMLTFKKPLDTGHTISSFYFIQSIQNHSLPFSQ